MYRVLTAAQCRGVESDAVRRTGRTLLDLMRAAGRAVASHVAVEYPDGDVVIVCGPGNNGGDGWVAARELSATGRAVTVLALRAPEALEGEARAAAREALEAGVAFELRDEPPSAAELMGAGVIVDALLGTGAALPLREPLDRWCAVLNESGVAVVSIDLPTGVDTDTGTVSPHAVLAASTVTFTSLKPGLVFQPGASCAGRVAVVDIGVPREIADVAGAPEVWTVGEYARLLPAPAPDAHKNSRGRVLVIAGSGRFPGAAVLAARGAARMGAGYVTLAVPEPVVAVAQAHLLSVPVLGLPAGRTRTLASSAEKAALDVARDYDAVVLGPGLSLADGTVAAVRGIVAGLDRPLVIDADALNALLDASELATGRRLPTVLTPHPGELARLLSVNVSEIQADRVSSCARLATDTLTVVLKGAGTVVSGAGRTVVNTSGTPALATAGTGDVLAGMIGALLAQGLAPLQAGALGAYLHGRAGECAAEALTTLCVTAEDVPEHLPQAVEGLLCGEHVRRRFRHRGGRSGWRKPPHGTS